MPYSAPMAKTAKVKVIEEPAEVKVYATYVGGPLHGGIFPKNVQGPWRRALTPQGEPLTAAEAIDALIEDTTSVAGVYLHRTRVNVDEKTWDHFYVHSGMNTAWSIINGAT